MSLDRPLSVMLPEPLSFPRAPYTEALAVHAKLLAGLHDKIFAELRAFCSAGPPFQFVNDYVALIVPAVGGVGVDMLMRGQAIDVTQDTQGIARALYLQPAAYRFRVVSMARGILSLHTFEVVDARTDTPRLRLLSRDDVVEPRKQKHRTSDGYTVTRWVAHDREPRYAWRRDPTEPASWKEAANRLLALYEGQIRERLQAYFEGGHPPEDTMVQVRASRRGDEIRVVSHALRIMLTAFYPAIGRAMVETGRAGYIPLLISGDQTGALLWIATDASDGGEPPPSMIEAMTEPWEPPADDDDDDDDEEEDEEEAESDRDGDVPAEAPASVAAKPTRKPDETDLIELLHRRVIELEVDALTTLTPAELDGEIASVGFDPAAERALGPGIRERVIQALVDKREASEGKP